MIAVVILYGLVIGSFLNVVILRFNTSESPMRGRSHCMSCNHELHWYDNIPLISWLLLRGRCRYCKAPISIQYPLIEGINAILWGMLYLYFGFAFQTLIYMVMTSALLVIAVVDERYFEIPVGQQIVLFISGVVNFIYNVFILGFSGVDYVVGAFSVSSFLLLVYLITSGRGLGFGDVKLMFLIGFIIGWKSIVVGFLIGCILAIIIHSLRMKLSDKEHMLAFGPYLSLGSFISLFIGEYLVNMYLSLIGVVI